MSTLSSGPQTVPDGASPVLQQLRDILLSSGYCDAGIAPTIDNRAPFFPDAGAAATPLNTLLRFFFGGDDCRLDDLAAALEPLTPQQLETAGVLTIHGDLASPLLSFQPYENLLFAFQVKTPETPPEESVMFISPSSIEVAHLMTRRTVQNALDIGTGCGLLAALVSGFTERVTAIDINAAAIRMAEFTARWNGLQNITFLTGNLLEPARGQQFDLIVCNPPFLICPVVTPFSSRFAFKHSGADGDDFCINLARGASQLLSDDGYFHMIFQWEEPAEGEWSANLERSFSGLGCDVWVMRFLSTSVEEYTREWIGSLTEEEQINAAALEEQSLAYFRGKNIGSLGTGLLTMVRSTAEEVYSWYEEAPEDRTELYGDAVPEIFEVRRWLMRASDEDVLQTVVLPAPALQLLQTSSLGDGGWVADNSEFNLTQGLKFSFGNVEPDLIEVLASLDGTRSVQEACESLAEQDPSAIADVVAAHLPNIRDLLWYGFLKPTPQEPTA